MGGEKCNGVCLRETERTMRERERERRRKEKRRREETRSTMPNMAFCDRRECHFTYTYDSSVYTLTYIQVKVDCAFLRCPQLAVIVKSPLMYRMPYICPKNGHEFLFPASPFFSGCPYAGSTHFSRKVSSV